MTSRWLPSIAGYVGWSSEQFQRGREEINTGNWAWVHPNIQYSLVVCDESGHTKFPFSFVILSWGELWLSCPELPLILP